MLSEGHSCPVRKEDLPRPSAWPGPSVSSLSGEVRPLPWHEGHIGLPGQSWVNAREACRVLPGMG